MKLNIQKYYYKLFNNKKYRRIKEQDKIQKSVEIFENEYKSYLYGIKNKIENNKKITFLHSGHLGDLVYALPVIKELSKDHECYFSAAHAAKDSEIALRLGENAGLKLPLAKSTWKQYEKMKSLGLGDLDKSGIAELTFKGRTLHS